MQETFVWRDFLVFRVWPHSTLFLGISLLPEVDYITVYNVLLGSPMENLCLMPATDFPFWASFVNWLLRSMTNIKEADITRHVGVPGNIIEYFTLLWLFVLNLLWEDRGWIQGVLCPYLLWVTECAVLRWSKVFSIEWKTALEWGIDRTLILHPNTYIWLIRWSWVGGWEVIVVCLNLFKLLPISTVFIEQQIQNKRDN